MIEVNTEICIRRQANAYWIKTTACVKQCSNTVIVKNKPMTLSLFGNISFFKQLKDNQRIGAHILSIPEDTSIK